MNSHLIEYKRKEADNIPYPSSAAVVVFGVHLSAQVAYRLDRKSLEIPFLLTLDFS